MFTSVTSPVDLQSARGDQTGLARRKMIELLLNKVESIEVSETTAGRLLGYGNDCGDRDRRHSATVSQSRAPAGISYPCETTSWKAIWSSEPGISRTAREIAFRRHRLCPKTRA